MTDQVHTLDQLPDGRYFDGTYGWEKDGEDWTPILAPSGMPSRPSLEGLQRAVTTFEPIVIAPPEPQVVEPTPADIDAFLTAWTKEPIDPARPERDRAGIAAVLALHDLKRDQHDYRAFHDGAGVYRRDEESWVAGGLRVMLTRRLAPSKPRHHTAARRLEDARHLMAFLRERAPHNIVMEDDLVIAAEEVYRLREEADQCRRDRNAAMADQDRLSGLLHARYSVELDTLQSLVWAWLNRHHAPWSPSDRKVLDLAQSIREELTKPAGDQS